MSSVKIRERRYKSGLVRFQVDIHYTGPEGAGRRQIQVPAHVTSRSGAQRWADEQRRLLERGEAPRTARLAAPAPPSAPTATVAEAGAWWVEAGLVARCSPNTIASRRRRVERYLAPVLGARRVDELGEGDAARLARSLEACSAGFARQVFRALRGALEEAKRRGCAIGLAVRLPKVSKRIAPRAYEPGPFEAIVGAARAASSRHLAAVLLLGEGGLRRGEVLGLQVADARAAAASGVLRVERARYEVDGEVVVLSPKTGKTRDVPLSPRLRSALAVLVGEHLGGDDAWLVLGARGEPATESALRSMVALCQRRAGLPEVGPHALRHTAATHLLAAGVDLRTVQDILGHDSVETTAGYLHVMPGQKRAAASRLEAYRAEESAVTSAGLAPRPRPRGRVKSCNRA